MKEFYGEIDDFIKHYENGTIAISDDIEFSMRYIVRQITHYILSKYMGGQKDAQGRRKSFRNIGNAIVDLEWRAKNIDRKSIEAHSTDGDYIFSLVVNKELQKWMKDNNFGKTIDDIQRKESEYGSVLVKKTETPDKLIIEPVKWEYTIVDPRDIAGGIKIEKNFLTSLDLKKRADVWDSDEIDLALKAAKKDKTNGENRIEVWDIEGEFEYSDLYDAVEGEAEDDTIGLYNVIVAVVQNKKFCLYKAELKDSRFKVASRKSVEGRDLGMGVWEEILEAQIATNDAVQGEKNAMDLAGKVVLKTNKKDLPTGAEIQDGEAIYLADGEYLESLQLMPSALPEFQNQIDNWFTNMQRDQSAYPGITGEEPKASTPFQSLALQASQGASIFNKRRDQDGFFFQEIIVDWVVPFMVKQINKEHKLTASYSRKELQQLDQAIREDHANTQSLKAILSVDPTAPLDKPLLPQGGLNKDALAAQMQAHLDKQGTNRTLTVPKGWITAKKIAEKVRFDITDEMTDDQRRLNVLATTLQSLQPGDPERVAVIQEMMEVAGVSSASFTFGAQAAPVAPPQATPSRVQQALPAGQQS